MLIKPTKSGTHTEKELQVVKSWLKKAKVEALPVTLGPGFGAMNNAFLSITNRLIIGTLKTDIFTHFSSVYEVGGAPPKGVDAEIVYLAYLGEVEELHWAPSKHSIVPTMLSELEGVEILPGETTTLRRTVRFEVQSSGGVRHIARTALKVYTCPNGQPRLRYYVDNLGLVAKSDLDFYAFLGSEQGECVTEWELHVPTTAAESASKE